MRKNIIVKISFATMVISGAAHAQQIDTETFKNNVNERFTLFIKNYQRNAERFERERAAQFTEFVNRKSHNLKKSESDVLRKLNETLLMNKMIVKSHNPEIIGLPSIYCDIKKTVPVILKPAKTK